VYTVLRASSILLLLLLGGCAATPNKPFRVCGEKPVYPCVSLGPTAAIVHRQENPRVRIDYLELQIQQLKKENQELKAILEQLTNKN
jgi:TolA-binding protein